MEDRQELERLRAALTPVDDGLVRVDRLIFHGISVDGRAYHTPADAVGKALLELEKVPYRLGVLDGDSWLLPRSLVEALVGRGLGEPLSADDEALLAAWQANELTSG